VGEVEGLVKRLRAVDPWGLPDTRRALEEAAAALTSLSTRLAECERERDEARNAAVESSGIAGEACIRATNAEARAERMEYERDVWKSKSSMHSRDAGEQRARAEALEKAAKWYDSVKQLRAALNKGEGWWRSPDAALN
jgi:hypothetical protein